MVPVTRWSLGAALILSCLAAEPSAQPSEAQRPRTHTSVPEAALPERPAAPARPRIGLALSGGGARGFAHVGILRVLERLRVPVDCIAGTSAGAAVGAAYAAGLDADAIEAALRKVDWNDIFDDASSRTDQSFRRKNEERPFQLAFTMGVGADGLRGAPGLSAGHKVELFLHEMLGLSRELPSFDQLAVPFRAVATDLARGEMVVLAQGSLVRAVRASMSVPSGFAPVREEGRLLVDGGLTRNLPVDIVRQLCADVVIAVDVGSPLLREDDLQSLFGVATQMVNILIEDNVRRSLAQLQPSDVLIAPELGAVSAVDFMRGVDGIPAGERAALAREQALAVLALSPAEWAAHQARRRGWQRPPEQVHDIRIDATRYVDARALEARILRQKAGVPLDRSALHADLNGLMARGDFAQINYRLVQEQGQGVLWLQPQEKTTGPDYLRFGLGAVVDSRANAYVNLPLGYTRTWVNRFGGEWSSLLQIGRAPRLGTQFFQPLSDDGRFYLMPRLMLEERPLSLFAGDLRIADYGIRQDQVEFYLGSQGALFDARVGLIAGRRSNRLRVGVPTLSDETLRHAGLAGGIRIDQLDAIDFPRRGWALELVGLAARRVLGGELSLNRMALNAQHAISFGDWTLATQARFGAVRSAQVPAAEAFSLGGFLNLSGLQINQLLGSGVQFGRAMLYHRALALPKPFGSGVYLGGSLEAGRILNPLVPQADTRVQAAASLFVAADTGVGPVYLGVGQTPGRSPVFYLLLGRP